MRIQHEVLKDKRAEYGEQVVKNLSKSLTEKYGRGFKKSNLYLFIAFYQEHPNFFQSVTGKLLEFTDDEIFQSVTGKLEEQDIYSILKPVHPLKLEWTHYSIILQDSNMDARHWYEQEAVREMWSTRTLQRNVSSQYYHRLLQSQNKDAVRGEMKQLTSELSGLFAESHRLEDEIKKQLGSIGFGIK